MTSAVFFFFFFFSLPMNLLDKFPRDDDHFQTVRTWLPEGNLFREAATDFSERCEDISQSKACQEIPYRARLLLAQLLIAM